MHADEVMEALGHLVGGTPGWASANVAEYAEQLGDLDDPLALKQACIALARGWDELRRPPIAMILEGYDRERSFRVKAIDPARRHCNGSGWVPYTGDPSVFVPCHRCNPALARVFADPDKRLRYDQGIEIEYLDVGVERVGRTLRYRDGSHPPICRPAEDLPEDIPSFAAGFEIAWQNYADEAKSLGRKPKRKHFDRLTGRIRETVEERIGKRLAR